MAESQTTTCGDLSINQPIKKTNVSHAYIEDLASKSQEKAGNQTSAYCEKLHPLELLIRLFPTQRRDVLALILKGCHGEVLRTIECVLPSHERALASLKTPAATLMHYKPSIPQRYFAYQFRSPDQGRHRTGHYSMYSSAPAYPRTLWWSSHKSVDWDRSVL